MNKGLQRCNPFCFGALLPYCYLWFDLNLTFPFTFSFGSRLLAADGRMPPWPSMLQGGG